LVAVAGIGAIASRTSKKITWALPDWWIGSIEQASGRAQRCQKQIGETESLIERLIIEPTATISKSIIH